VPDLDGRQIDARSGGVADQGCGDLVQLGVVRDPAVGDVRVQM
jgi:hypothetical protein